METFVRQFYTEAQGWCFENAISNVIVRRAECCDFNLAEAVGADLTQPQGRDARRRGRRRRGAQRSGRHSGQRCVALAGCQPHRIHGQGPCKPGSHSVNEVSALTASFAPDLQDSPDCPPLHALPPPQEPMKLSHTGERNILPHFSFVGAGEGAGNSWMNGYAGPRTFLNWTTGIDTNGFPDSCEYKSNPHDNLIAGDISPFKCCS